MQNAIDSKVSGLAVHAVERGRGHPVVQKAAAAGIPVVAFNQGIDHYTEAGAKMYFGSDEDWPGRPSESASPPRTVGGKTLCIIQAPGLGGAGDPLRRV